MEALGLDYRRPDGTAIDETMSRNELALLLIIGAAWLDAGERVVTCYTWSNNQTNLQRWRGHEGVTVWLPNSIDHEQLITKINRLPGFSALYRFDRDALWLIAPATRRRDRAA